MRYFISACFIILMLLNGTAAHAGELREIEMTDGSVISGEILSLSGGVYTVRSPTLGTLSIEETKVRSIKRMSGAAASQQDPAPSDGQVRAMQERMLRDPDVMNKIQGLERDPDFQKVLEDPEMMKAVNAGDIAALMANPQFLKLMNKPAVQDIQKQVK